MILLLMFQAEVTLNEFTSEVNIIGSFLNIIHLSLQVSQTRSIRRQTVRINSNLSLPHLSSTVLVETSQGKNNGEDTLSFLYFLLVQDIERAPDIHILTHHHRPHPKSSNS